MHVHVNARVNVISVIQGLVCCCKLWIEMFSRGNLVLFFLSHRLLEYSRVNWQSPYRRVMASIISFGSEVEAQLGKRLQASVVRQMKASEMATQWTLLYHLTSRLRVLLQSAPSKRLLFEYYVKQLLKNQ